MLREQISCTKTTVLGNEDNIGLFYYGIMIFRSGKPPLE